MTLGDLAATARSGRRPRLRVRASKAPAASPSSRRSCTPGRCGARTRSSRSSCRSAGSSRSRATSASIRARLRADVLDPAAEREHVGARDVLRRGRCPAPRPRRARAPRRGSAAGSSPAPRRRCSASRGCRGRCAPRAGRSSRRSAAGRPASAPPRPRVRRSPRGCACARRCRRRAPRRATPARGRDPRCAAGRSARGPRRRARGARPSANARCCALSVTPRSSARAVLREIQEVPAPAAADVEHALAGAEVELLGDPCVLARLGGVESLAGGREHPGRVAEALVEHEREDLRVGARSARRRVGARTRAAGPGSAACVAVQDRCGVIGRRARPGRAR